MPLPSLGDERKTYPVVLTEPEINTIHAVAGFVKGFVNAAGAAGVPAEMRAWFEHYGPTVRALSGRLAEFDEGDNYPEAFDPKDNRFKWPEDRR